MTHHLNQESTLCAPGMKMPVIGLGTWQSSEDEIERALDVALSTGYRHIDTALWYRNESAIGGILRKWFISGKIKREELFIVTKLPPTANRPEFVAKALEQSLNDLQLSYVDLYLIHHPVGLAYNEEEGSFLNPPKTLEGKVKIDRTTDHVAIWKAMEEQVNLGLTKAIGVSNFNIRQIERILKSAAIPPATNQVEMYLYCQKKELHKFCKKAGVTITAYFPLGSPGLERYIKDMGRSADDIRSLNPLEDPMVENIAHAHKKTPAQILLRHLLQLGVAVIPKSVTPSRIESNFDVFDFELSTIEMTELNLLDKEKEGSRFAVPYMRGIEEHPEYPD
uniref:NADP-dependent oxidoreductase domain-containing protein n=1 Tax=Clastoptera arizonana TaxID=38151 RepID=A0A1B6BXR5_9HEMI